MEKLLKTISIPFCSSLFLSGLMFFLTSLIHGQYRLPQAKLSDEKSQTFLITNATIVPAPGEKLESASLYVKDGKIAAIGKNLIVPPGTLQRDAGGAWIYPSFIDLFSSYGMSAAKTGSGDRGYPMGPQYESGRPGSFLWNQCLKPETDASGLFQENSAEGEELRKLGFGYVAATPKDGIMRGTSCLVSLNDGELSGRILKNRLFPQLSFQKGNSTQQYPSSQMGAIALIRQTFLDADWFASRPVNEQGPGMEALIRSRKQMWLFETSQKYEVLRAAALAREFSLSLLIKGRGDEYQRLNEIKATGFPLLLSLQFPEMPDLEDPLDANLVSLADLKHWELAPYNAARLAEAKIPFAFTLADLKDQKSFFAQLKKVLACGLSEADALAALTSTPARLAGMQDQIGKLVPGAQASFFLSTGNIFKGNARILDHFVAGRKFSLSARGSEKTGLYRLRIDADSSLKFRISRKDGNPELLILQNDTTKIPVAGQFDFGRILFSSQLKNLDSSARLQFSGWETSSGYAGWMEGLPSGRKYWSARLLQPLKDSLYPEKPVSVEKPGEVWFPFQAYGKPATAPAPANNWLIRNATVWTNEREGVRENYDILVKNGLIHSLGKNLPAAPGVTIIDATGKHVTPGIIDEHSHIAISKGVNEGSSTTSMEVRIGDVVDGDDVNIFRHLAGGVTAVQQLHGSANAIGGQSSLIKMRWGSTPEAMKIQNAPGFIKFALGENVKQSNWGDFNTTRYPQTRMGVEQLYFDAFGKAKEYIRERNAAKPGIPFRRDLKLETLAEILEGKRFITCHSYVQSEINMLMHVADSMKFKVNTFTHILEGYKVADKMKKHGAGASTFSDWWAYKMEVKDAIPYNAALMNQAGLTVAINSDDAEMATRLNQEAAKAIKYGGVSEEEALKMVTLNPAKLLHLDQRMGSILPGKDADLVIWTDNPLTITARAEKTFVDGKKLYDRDELPELESTIKAEKQRLIQKTLKLKQGGQPAFSPQLKVQKQWHCEDLGED
jgi:imidazolonepropionase-like amidohydrolase